MATSADSKSGTQPNGDENLATTSDSSATLDTNNSSGRDVMTMRKQVELSPAVATPASSPGDGIVMSGQDQPMEDDQSNEKRVELYCQNNLARCTQRLCTQNDDQGVLDLTVPSSSSGANVTSKMLTAAQPTIIYSGSNSNGNYRKDDLDWDLPQNLSLNDSVGQRSSPSSSPHTSSPSVPLSLPGVSTVPNPALNETVPHLSAIPIPPPSTLFPIQPAHASNFSANSPVKFDSTGESTEARFSREFTTFVQKHFGLSSGAPNPLRLLGAPTGFPVIPSVNPSMMNLLPLGSTISPPSHGPFLPSPGPLNLGSNASPFDLSSTTPSVSTPDNCSSHLFAKFSEVVALCTTANDQQNGGRGTMTIPPPVIAGRDGLRCSTEQFTNEPLPLNWSQMAASNFACLQQGERSTFDSMMSPYLAAQGNGMILNGMKDLTDSMTASREGSSNLRGYFDGSDDPCAYKHTNPIRKYVSHEECGSASCCGSGLREHYHCKSCDKVIIRREEMIRHAKWHRKREESLQYGFMRYSPNDNCGVVGCAHNGRQTHYHCLKPNCSKVYISTSDVQMHANFHRKDAVIIQEGFQRFRASENCGIRTCPFYHERTTHFHCRRPNCRFTFKNKADMEKHKLHHQKNDNFAKDGFRKYIKCESCGFPGCKYSGIINHIHCIRPGCDYVVHSSSQILSHKRKHDRRFSHLISRPSDSSLLSDMSSPNERTTHNSRCSSDIDLSPAKFSRYDRISRSETTNQDMDEDEEDDVATDQMDTCSQSRPASGGNSMGEDSPMDTNENKPVNGNDDISLEGSGKYSVTELFNQVSRLVNWSIRLRKRWTTLHRESNQTDEPAEITLKALLTERDEAAGLGTKHKETVDSSSTSCEEETIPDYALVERITRFVKQYYKTFPAGVKCGRIDCCRNKSDADESQVDQRQHRHCLWPGCPSEQGNSREDVLDTFEDPDENWCRYWISHMWQAALIYRGLVCDHSGSACPKHTGSDESPVGHLHCFFQYSCSYLSFTDQMDVRVIYNHLVSHDNRLLCPWSRPHGQSKSNGDKLYSTSSPYTPRISDSTLPNTNNAANSPDVPRRRGRPPKYTKYVRVPRVNIPEELCQDDPSIRELKRSMFFEHGEDDKPSKENDPESADPTAHVVCGVKLFPVGVPCPDDLCDYHISGLEHYHCVRPRCYMASGSLELMNVHRREFHNHIAITPGFEHFDGSVDCRRFTCHNKKMNQHFHCIYPNCDYAFIRPTTMIQHARKHEEFSKPYRCSDNPFVSNKITVRQAAIHQLSTPTQPNPFSFENAAGKPPFLPLGMPPLVAAHLPTMFPSSQSTTNNAHVSVRSPVDANTSDGGSVKRIPLDGLDSNPSQLPGFLPIWAAAMAAANAMAKAGGWLNVTAASSSCSSSSSSSSSSASSASSSLLNPSAMNSQHSCSDSRGLVSPPDPTCMPLALDTRLKEVEGAKVGV